jgi:hypothetical protein
MSLDPFTILIGVVVLLAYAYLTIDSLAPFIDAYRKRRASARRRASLRRRMF